jgi:hypothetical protein
MPNQVAQTERQDASERDNKTNTTKEKGNDKKEGGPEMETPKGWPDKTWCRNTPHWATKVIYRATLIHYYAVPSAIIFIVKAMKGGKLGAIPIPSLNRRHRREGIV